MDKIELNNMKIDDELRCKKTINNLLYQPLFIENEIYKILYMDNDIVILNHTLYGNEYSEFDINFVEENFEKI